jgi:hypothetical protein
VWRNGGAGFVEAQRIHGCPPQRQVVSRRVGARQHLSSVPFRDGGFCSCWRSRSPCPINERYWDGEGSKQCCESKKAPICHAQCSSDLRLPDVISAA